jgi:hypothetical protein
MIRTYAFERRAVFIGEQRSKTYNRYVARAAESKILLCAKNDLPARALLDLGRHGA